MKQKKVEDFTNEVIIKNPYNLKDKKREAHIPENALEDLKKMSEKANLKEIEEQLLERNTNRKRVRFSDKKLERVVVHGMNLDKNDENMKRVGII